jgi:hypothetical protein
VYFGVQWVAQCCGWGGVQIPYRASELLDPKNPNPYPGVTTALHFWKTAVKIVANFLLTLSLFYEKNTNFHLQWYKLGIKANFYILCKCGILISESKLVWKCCICIRLQYLPYCNEKILIGNHENGTIIRFHTFGTSTYCILPLGADTVPNVKLLVIDLVGKWVMEDLPCDLFLLTRLSSLLPGAGMASVYRH